MLLALLATPFDTAAAGTDYGERGGDVTLPTDAGDWTLSAAWTGCDSFVFLGVDPDDGYTSIFLDADMKRLLTKGPTDAQYLLFADARTGEATDSQAQLRTIVDNALADAGDDDRAWWTDRLHVVTTNVASTPGWPGTVMAGYSFPVVGLDRTQTIREIGYEVAHYDFEAARAERLAAEDATIVPVFTAADTRTADWPPAPRRTSPPKARRWRA